MTHYNLKPSSLFQVSIDQSKVEIFLIQICHLVQDQKVLLFLKPVEPLILFCEVFDQGVQITDRQGLAIYTYEETLEDAISSVADNIQFLWTHYALKEGSNLTTDGLVFANKVRSSFQDVTNLLLGSS